MTDISTNGHVPQLFLAARVARMHYLQGLTNLEIAERMGISRFRVARLLERALKTGIVQITINSPLGIDQDLGTALIERFDLAEALVYPVAGVLDETVDKHIILDNVGGLAARYLSDVLHDGGKFGVTWGNAVEAVAKALPAIGGLPNADVIQMVGGLSSAQDSMQAMEVLSRFSNAAGGNLYALHAPLVVSEASTAKSLRADGSIRRTLSQVGELDAAIVGIGSWNPPESQMIKLFDAKTRSAALAKGATADLSGIIIDQSGDEISGGLADVTIRADAKEFRRIQSVIGVASGVGKAHAVRAALAGNWIDVLVTDSLLASALLAEP